MNRRAYLSGLGATTVASLSGCLSPFDDSTVQLGGVVVGNYLVTPQFLEVSILENRTTHYDGELKLQASEANRVEPRWLDCEWPEDERAFVIEMATEQEELRLDLATETENREEDCFVASITIGGMVSGLSWSYRACDRVDGLLCDFASE